MHSLNGRFWIIVSPVFWILICFSLVLRGQTLEETLSKMTLREKIGQLFIVGISHSDMTPELRTFIQDYHPGAFILFSKNIKTLSQVYKLNQSLNENSRPDIPPFIAVDEEGGLVTRIHTIPPLPNALALGQTKSIELARSFGRETGRILHSLGFNMNLAPVLDVANPYDFSFIGPRSFGSDPDLVGKIGAEVALGYADSKIIPTAKHFPGTGSISRDPHKFIITQTANRSDLNSELESFRRFIGLDVPSAIMMSHFKYPALDPSETPATYSKKITTELLRNRLGFEGLIITDDLQMNNSKLFKSSEQAALAALLAGADLVMLAWSHRDQRKAMDHVFSAVKKGILTELQIKEKLLRILKIKLAFGKNPRAGVEISQTNYNLRRVVSSELQKINSMILTHNLSFQIDQTIDVEFSERSNSTPMGLLNRSICFFSSLSSFNRDVAKYFKNGARFFSLIENGDQQLQKTIDKEHCGISVISVVGKKTAQQAELLKDPTKSNIVIINLSSPYIVKNPEKYRRVINLFFPHSGVGEVVGKNIRRIL